MLYMMSILMVEDFSDRRVHKHYLYKGEHETEVEAVKVGMERAVRDTPGFRVVGQPLVDAEVMSVRRGHVTDCPGCGVKPGEKHIKGCEVEICSQCGSKVVVCFHKTDKVFSRWTGILPGEAEAQFLGITIQEFREKKLSKIFGVKPKV